MSTITPPAPPSPHRPPPLSDRPSGSFLPPALPALRLVPPPHAARRVARVMWLLFLIAPVILYFVPWQQSVTGMGRVIAYAPLDRQLVIEAPIYGRVMEWHVQEGSRVKQGDPIARIADNDPNYLLALNNQKAALEQKIAIAQDKARIYTKVVNALREVQVQQIQAGTTGIQVTKNKVLTEEQEVRIYQVDQTTDLAQMERVKKLHPQGLFSTRDLELADQKTQASTLKLRKAEVELASARNEVQIKEAYLAEIKAKSQAEIDKNNAEVRAADGDVAEATKELQDIQVKINRQLTQEVQAPRDGTVLRLLVNQGTEQVKDGDPIAILIPNTDELAVEMWVDGNDQPLIRGKSHEGESFHVGDPVRLQFEGWPAIQFTGWPSVAVGTFGGRVSLVDSHDDGKGKFRVLITKSPGEEWPELPYLRQGVRAKGWVLLRQVPLGFELWRRLNAFPPTVDTPESPKLGKGKSGGKDVDAGSDAASSSKEKVKVKRPK